MRRAIPAIVAMALAACVTVDPEMTITDNVTDWRDEIIYQIVVDRFEDGDPNNNHNVDYRRDAAYHGGDWRGIIDRLDYLEALGVTALWISPVVRNVEEDAGFASYHGYWTQSFTDINRHFGSLEDLRALVRACHARGIKVILDVVVNHIGQLFYYDINRNGQPDIVFFGGGGPGPGSRNPSQPSPLRRASEWDPEYDTRGVQGFTQLGENGPAPIVWVEQPSINRVPPWPPEFRNPLWYNRRGRVTAWENPAGLTWDQIREQEMRGDFPGGLKDLDTTRADVREALIEVFRYWITAADFDGFRIDTLKHVEPEFFEVFAPAMRRHAASLGKRNFFMFGEAFDGNDWLLGSYTHGEGVDSVFYFSAKYQVFDGVFGRGDPPSRVRALYEERLRKDDTAWMPQDDPEKPRYGDRPKAGGLVGADGEGLAPHQVLVHFLDNHDVPRWLYDFPDVRKLRNALVYLLTTDGIPCIYYGTEQDFDGGPDPANREDMWRSGFRTDGETFRHLQRLIRLRKKYAPLRRGSVEFRWATDHVGDEPDAGLLAFERVYRDERVLVIINTHDARTARTRLGPDEVLRTGFAAGTRVVDVLNDGETYTIGGGGTLDVQVPPRGARILVPRGRE